MISVVMPVYNAHLYLRDAIESILAQSFMQFEFIIVNDGSTDESLSIIQTYHDPRIVIIDQKNHGLAHALNQGILRARSQYIARIDADDIALPERLEKQYQYLKKNKHCIALGSNAVYIQANGREIVTTKQDESWQVIKAKIIHQCPFIHSSVMFRKDAALKCGLYDERIKQNFEDMFFWIKMAEYGELHNLPEVLVKHRLQPDGITNNLKRHEIAQVLKLLVNMSRGQEPGPDICILNERMSKKKSRPWLMSNYYTRIGGMYLFRRDDSRKEAAACYLRSILYNPLNIRAWFMLGLSMQCRTIINRWKTIRGLV